MPLRGIAKPASIVLEGFPGRAAVGVSGVVVGEIVAREATVSALGFVEHWDMRLDTAIVHEPVQHLGRAIGAVADQALGIQVEVLQRALDHALCRQHLGLADRRRRLDIDNDRMVGIDEIVGRIGEEGWPAVSGCPSCCRIGRRDELGRHLACCTERRIIEDGEIFRDGASRRFRRQTRGAFDAVAVAGVGLDQAGVDSKPFATD